MNKIDLKEEKNNFNYEFFYKSLVDNKNVLNHLGISKNFINYLISEKDFDKRIKNISFTNHFEYPRNTESDIILANGRLFNFFDKRINYRNIIILAQTYSESFKTESELEPDRMSLTQKYFCELSFEDKPEKFILLLSNDDKNLSVEKKYNSNSTGFSYKIIKKLNKNEKINSEFFLNYMEGNEPLKYVFINKNYNFNFDNYFTSHKENKKNSFNGYYQKWYIYNFLNDDFYLLPIEYLIDPGDYKSLKMHEVCTNWLYLDLKDLKKKIEENENLDKEKIKSLYYGKTIRRNFEVNFRHIENIKSNKLNIDEFKVKLIKKYRLRSSISFKSR